MVIALRDPGTLQAGTEKSGFERQEQFREVIDTPPEMSEKILEAKDKVNPIMND